MGQKAEPLRPYYASLSASPVLHAKRIINSLIFVQGQDLIHEREVNAHATEWSREVGLQT